jgi:hypothetical protein
MQIVLSPACFEGVNPAEVPEGYTGIPNALMRDSRLTLGGKGLLWELIARKGEFDIEAAKAAEMERRKQPDYVPEDLDELLAELVEVGYIALPEK